MTNITFSHHHTLVRKASFYSFCTAGQVLIAISSYARETFKGSGKWACFPSYAKLSEDTGIVERTVQTHVKRLIDIGMISISKQLNGRVNVYEMNIDKIFNPTGEILSLLTKATPAGRVASIISEAVNSLNEWKEKKGFGKKKEKSYPQPKQFKIADNDGYTGKTSDLKDPTNSVSKKDLLEEEQRADSAIPSPEKIMPSKRMVEMDIFSLKSTIKGVLNKITDLLSSKASHTEVEKLKAELEYQQGLLAKKAPYAKYYGLSLA